LWSIPYVAVETNMSFSRMNSTLKTAKQKEVSRGVRYHSEEEDDSGSDWDDADDMPTTTSTVSSVSVPAVKTKKKATNSLRKQERTVGRTEDDDSANVFYQAANPMFAAKFK